MINSKSRILKYQWQKSKRIWSKDVVIFFITFYLVNYLILYTVKDESIVMMSHIKPIENKKVEHTLSEDPKVVKIEEGGAYNKKQQMLRTSVMTRLILTMVWRNLIRNPNSYSCVSGLLWSLISFRYFQQIYYYYYYY